MSSATLTTPIKIRPDTKARIESIKVHPRETIDDVIRRVLDERESQERRSAT